MADEPFRTALDRILDEALADAGRQNLVGQLRAEYDTSPLVDGPVITAHKHSAFLLLSVDRLLDAGLITEEEARAQGWTPYVAPPVPWYRRLRWRWQAWRERAGRRIGGWIAGVDLSERDEDW